MTIHWCGTGLSAIPGLRRLIEGGHKVTVWNRTVEKARAEVGDLTDDIRAFDIDALGAVLEQRRCDRFHAAGRLARAAWQNWPFQKRPTFVSSSYIAPEMRALDDKAREAGVVLVNEVGSGPRHRPLDGTCVWSHDYRASDAFDPQNHLSFISYCGGIPKNPNPFRYKFSWSPLGVLKALRSPSRSIRDYAPLDVARPWDAITSYIAPLPGPESFEVYPNRDSIPFMKEYRFEDHWPVKEFVRGTLRLNGWAEAWSDVFTEIETLSGPEGDARLKEMSDQFWAENAYDEGEPDRVVLCVGLKAEKDGLPVWHKTYVMDAWGDARGTAMARLVSIPVSLAVEAVLNRAIPAGVHAAPSDPKLVQDWMAEIDTLAQHLQVVDHTA